MTVPHSPARDRAEMARSLYENAVDFIDAGQFPQSNSLRSGMRSQSMKWPSAIRHFCLSVTCTALIIAPANATTSDAEFMSAVTSAMNTMMTAMKIRSSGDPDADFVASMVPHHQGAIDMAQSELRYGRNEKLHRIAQEIIVTQQEEIAAMRLAAAQPLPPSLPAPDQISGH